MRGDEEGKGDEMRGSDIKSNLMMMIMIIIIISLISH